MDRGVSTILAHVYLIIIFNGGISILLFQIFSGKCLQKKRTWIVHSKIKFSLVLSGEKSGETSTASGDTAPGGQISTSATAIPTSTITMSNSSVDAAPAAPTSSASVESMLLVFFLFDKLFFCTAMKKWKFKRGEGEGRREIITVHSGVDATRVMDGHTQMAKFRDWRFVLGEWLVPEMLEWACCLVFTLVSFFSVRILTWAFKSQRRSVQNNRQVLHRCWIHFRRYQHFLV